jgi:hypothetical protein
MIQIRILDWHQNGKSDLDQHHPQHCFFIEIIQLERFSDFSHKKLGLFMGLNWIRFQHSRDPDPIQKNVWVLTRRIWIRNTACNR